MTRVSRTVGNVDEKDGRERRNPMAIYQSPSVETLDASLVPGRANYAVPPTATTTTTSTPSKSTAFSMMSTPTRAHGAKKKLNITPRSNRREQQRQKNRRRGRPNSNDKKKTHDFQHNQDQMTATVRTIDVAARTAFETVRPVSIDEWHRVASSAERLRKVSMRKRLSPSLQHLELLHRMQSVQTVRQIAFSPSVGMNSDVFVEWDEDLTNHQDNPSSSNEQQQRRRRRPRRDGRYRSIDPLQASQEALPPVPPILSNRKHRLPMRSDVGFPNASATELQLKQNEIRLETQWEEASPRLIALLTSDDLGTAIDYRDHNVNDVPKECLEGFNGGGLPGMPFAGKELIIAKERNAIHFSKGKPPKRRVAANRNSILAPPLGATYSSTMSWRPRLFHDRPASMVYALACPLAVDFDAGDIEPLVCSLTLYTLPGRQARDGQPYGKSSEDFYFPAGNWEGKIDLDLAHGENGEVDEEMVETWYNRKQKALFGYDLMQLPDGQQSLHVVLQVYKGYQRDATTSYVEGGKPAGRKSIAKRIKRKLGKRSKDKDPTDANIRNTSESWFEKYGTDLLTPLCFGVVPMFPGTDPTMEWPQGSRQTMQLHAFPGFPESQQQFVDRLTKVAADERNRAAAEGPGGNLNTSVSADSINSGDGDGKTDNADPVGSAEAVTPRKPRLFKPSIARRARSTSAISEMKQNTVLQPFTKPIGGRATVFTSFLNFDFTQPMLSEPTGWVGAQEGSLPRLLVDVSGDCAIALNTPQENNDVNNDDDEEDGNNNTTNNTRKRSDLVRWPQSSQPAGYCDAAEIREMLFLPPRERHYDVDTPSFHSMLNVLYIYPRVLKWASSEELKLGKPGRRSKQLEPALTIRVRLVQAILNNGGEQTQAEAVHLPTQSLYNAAPWAGSQLLTELYTSVHSVDVANRKDGLLLRDEIKVRLPLILDGTFYLEFTLLQIRIDEDDTTKKEAANHSDDEMEALAETMIPISSSSTREASSGVRVTTVIPNGSHRLKLGQWQMQFETRLVSSVHVADPTAATVLRDFPFATNPNGENDPERFQALALVPSRSILGKSPTAEPIVDLKVPYHQLLSTASETTLLAHFQLYFHMHMCNLVHRSKFDSKLVEFLSAESPNEFQIGDEGDDHFLMQNMRSLCQILNRIRKKLGGQASFSEGILKFDHFCKNLLDSFDEGALSDRSKNVEPDDDFNLDISSGMHRSRSEASVVSEQKVEAREDVLYDNRDDMTDGGAVHLRSKDSVRADVDMRISKTASKISAQGMPLSRVAYGASKTDRMKAEAEMNQEGARFSHLFDDDETVLTAIYTIKDGSVAGGPPGLERSGTWGAIDDDVSITDKLAIASNTIKTSTPTTKTKVESFTEFGFAKRVRSAAQVMIAPCIAPSFSAGIAGLASPTKPYENANAGSKAVDRTEALDGSLQASVS